MASKAELEKEVTELREKLAGLTNADTPALLARVDQLKSDLDSAAAERDEAIKKSGLLAIELDSTKRFLTEARAEVSEKVRSFERLQTTYDTLELDRTFLQGQVNKLESMLNNLPETAKDSAPIDGVWHKVIWRSTVKDLVYDGYHKRHVPEDATVLVVQKTGG